MKSSHNILILLVASLLPITSLVCATTLIIFNHPYASITPFIFAYLTLPHYDFHSNHS